MSKFFQESERVRVEFPDGEWVEVKEELSQADHDYILSKMARAEQSGKEPKMVLQLGKLPLLERAITDWSFSEHGTRVPINRDTISKLRSRYRTKVLIELDRLNEEALEFARKN